MRIIALISLPLVAIFALPSLAGRISPEGPSYKTVEPKVRFVPLEIYVDPAGKPLGAYQFELRAKTGQIKIVGVEGGTHSAFKQAPYYDPAALADERIIVAAYSTDEHLPTKRTHVATVHLQVIGDTDPEYQLRPTVLADDKGRFIDAEISPHKEKQSD
jgi:hypothetical protein